MHWRQLWGAADRDARAFALGYAVLLPAFLVPLFVTPVLPSLDGPFHLAMADMLGKARNDASPYAAYYSPQLWPMPPALPWTTLALLARILAPLTALKLLVGVYIASLPLAVAAFARRLGNAAVPALLAFPLTYNVGLHYGFLGYTFSLPLLFVMLIHAVALLDQKSAPLRCSLWFIASSCLLYGFHLETYGLGCVAVLALLATARSSASRRSLAVLALLPSIALFSIWHVNTPYLRAPAQRTLGDAFHALIATRKAEATGSWVSEILGRLEALPTHLLRGFRDGSDRVASLTILVVVVAYAIVVLRPRFRGVPNHPLRWTRPTLFVIALLAYVALPHHFDAYEAMSVAPRLAPLVVAAALAALPLRTVPSLGHYQVLNTLYATVLLVGLTFAAVVTHQYRAFAREIVDFEQVVADVPQGGRTVGLVFDAESKVVDVDSIFRGFPSLYVALKPAPSSMVALRYCGMRHFPCSPTARAASVPAPDPWAPGRFDAKAALSFFDYVLVRGRAPNTVLPRKTVVKIARRGAWTAYRSLSDP
jgi:hypothetical protein